MSGGHGKTIVMSENDHLTHQPQDRVVQNEEDNQLHQNSQSGGQREEDESEKLLGHIPTEFSLGRLVHGVKRFRLLCGAVVNHEAVQFFVVILIAINAIMMGIATFDVVTKNPQVEYIFEQVDVAFLCVFTIEIALQLIYHGLKLFLDGWLVFDLTIIVASWSLSSVQIIRAFRIFRALRLVTRIKIMKNLVLAVFSVMPRMNAIGLLLALIFYIFGVMMTLLFKDLYSEGQTEEDYFGHLGMTMFTLFQMMTMDDWAGISRQVIAVYFWSWVPFFAFVVISAFVVVNLIIAVICDAVASLNDNVKSKIHGSYDEDDSQGIPDPSLSEQLKMLEDQVDELCRSQEQVMSVLGRLTGNSMNGSTSDE